MKGTRITTEYTASHIATKPSFVVVHWSEVSGQSFFTVRDGNISLRLDGTHRTAIGRMCEKNTEPRA